jgi:hypothetical protein
VSIVEDGIGHFSLTIADKRNHFRHSNRGFDNEPYTNELLNLLTFQLLSKRPC